MPHTYIPPIIYAPKRPGLAVAIRRHAGIIKLGDGDARAEVRLVRHAADVDHHWSLLARARPAGQLNRRPEGPLLASRRHGDAEGGAAAGRLDLFLGRVGVIPKLVFLKHLDDFWLAALVPLLAGGDAVRSFAGHDVLGEGRGPGCVVGRCVTEGEERVGKGGLKGELLPCWIGGREGGALDLTRGDGGRLV